jgi:hypothetical protein
MPLLLRRCLLGCVLGVMALQAVEPGIAKQKNKKNKSSSTQSSRVKGRASYKHPDYWRRDPNRWKQQYWSPVQRYDHWNRPCNGLGCDPRTWAPSSYRNTRRGWYNSSTYRGWGWWGSRSAAWDYGALAAGSIIAAAITSAQRTQAPTIVVPDSSYQLNYRSVQAETDNGIRFLVSRGGVTYQMDADCRDGELNGHAPNNLSEAQLLNAACEVAYGS